MTVKELMKQLTLSEKAHLISGKDAWSTYPVDRLNIPSMMVSDGPHGLRKPVSEDGDIGIHESVKAICYPPAVGIASSWDKALAEKMGTNLSYESQSHDLGVLLGPGANIKRSPLCGRNFEYFSEDPVLSGTIAGHLIKGIQSKGVSASLKHFVANNQETDRMAVSSNIGKRALREIYAKSFEKAFEVEMPWSIMCAYNRVNGTYVSESKDLLTDLLRNELGFEGFVVSDWGAVNRIETSLSAGVDLEMPGNLMSPERVVEAISQGRLSEAQLDQAVERLLTVVMKTAENRQNIKVDLDAYHQDAIEIAKGCLVLLKNEKDILPLDQDEKILLVGEFAEKPRIQGEGSSMVNPYQVDVPLEVLKGAFKNLDYKQGYRIDEKAALNLQDEALENIEAYDKVLMFVGLPDAYEAEGVDRTHLRLPKNQEDLIASLVKRHKEVVLVLMNGAVVEINEDMEKANGILEAWLLGEGAAHAITSVLLGETNPSGRLAETIPLKLSDTPSYLNFPGYNNNVNYREDIFVGYRYYDKKEMSVSYPFGHGLSYSTFEYSKLRLENNLMDDKTLTLKFEVTNTSDISGYEVVQVYMSPPSKEIVREEKKLLTFDKVWLKGNETKEMTFTIHEKDLTYYDEFSNMWQLEGGLHKILVGTSSRELNLEGAFEVKGSSKKKLTLYDPLKSIMDHTVYKEKFGHLLHGLVVGDISKDLDFTDQVTRNLYSFYVDMPLIKMINFSKGQLTEVIVKHMLDEINKK